MDDERWVGEREIPFRVWAAKRTVRMHVPVDDRPAHCTDCAGAYVDTCPRLLAALRTLLDHGMPERATAAAG